MHYLGCEKDFLAEPNTGDQIFAVQLPVHGMFRFCVPMHNEPTSISNDRYYNLIGALHMISPHNFFIQFLLDPFYKE